MKQSFSLLSLTALFLFPLMSSACAQSLLPVEIGGDTELDACASQGRIVRLDPNGDNFLSVRTGPGSKRQEIDRLSAGALVTICDKRGRWLGIIYAAPGTTTDCGVSSPAPARLPYDGPCRSGWVHEGFVVVVAG
ncbi:integron [Agrobacterium cavarae]|uniref:integron n=1 Tax=Agrobacterium cavarae TaxID=2528239 RepID=UPI003EE77D51